MALLGLGDVSDEGLDEASRSGDKWNTIVALSPTGGL